MMASEVIRSVLFRWLLILFTDNFMSKIPPSEKTVGVDGTYFGELLSQLSSFFDYNSYIPHVTRFFCRALFYETGPVKHFTLLSRLDFLF